mmetsp:Transcript_95066/g.306222  ORF Transcript_95066/g.306222 Transcript_95066/m.306222 type:complete len:162 (-) Transcript_95066:545-1030(-)
MAADVSAFVTGNNAGKAALSSVEGLEAHDEAYLQLCGGMRQDVVVQFPMEGIYTISLTGYPGLNPSQVLATVVVTASEYCGSTGNGKECKAASLTSYKFTAARDVKSVLARSSDRHVGLDFEQQLNRTKAPWAPWGVAHATGSSFQTNAANHMDMVVTGGT